MLHSFTILDDLTIASSGAVEVAVELQNGERRWCFFMTPEALSHCGDFLTDTNIRVHFGAPHMIVVSQIDKQIIEKTLLLIDQKGELKRCTRATK